MTPPQATPRDIKPWVYIASPYTKGDPAINTRFQCATFDTLLSWGTVVPYAPLWSHFQHTIFPRVYADWLRYDHDIITRMDACLRLPSTHPITGYREEQSNGADSEVAAFKAAGKPVFYSMEELRAWLVTSPASPSPPPLS
jgi:hypothetical protein